MMTFSVETIANKIISLADGNGITHMKLQKLIYLAHENFLKSTGRPLANEDPEVWQFGPVFSTLYHRLKHYRNSPITVPIIAEAANEVICQDAEKAIIETWEKYKGYTGPALSDLTHRTGTPWRILAEKYKYSVPFGLTIPSSLILESLRARKIPMQILQCMI